MFKRNGKAGKIISNFVSLLIASLFAFNQIAFAAPDISTLRPPSAAAISTLTQDIVDSMSSRAVESLSPDDLNSLLDIDLEKASVEKLASIVRRLVEQDVLEQITKRHPLQQLFLLYSAAPGTGKGELMEATFEGKGKYADLIGKLILYHSRDPRVDKKGKCEKDGIKYHFRTQKQLEALAQAGKIKLAWVNRQLQGVATDNFTEEDVAIENVTGASNLAIGDVIKKIDKNNNQITLERNGKEVVLTPEAVTMPDAKKGILLEGDKIKSIARDIVKVDRPIFGMSAVFAGEKPVILEGGYGWFKTLSPLYKQILTVFISPFSESEIAQRTRNTAWIEKEFGSPEDGFIAYRAMAELIEKNQGEIDLASETEDSEKLRDKVRTAVEAERIAFYNARLIESPAFIQDLNNLLKTFGKGKLEKDKINTARAMAYEVMRRITGRDESKRFSRGKRPEYTEGETDPQFDRYNRVLEGVVQILNRQDYELSGHGKVIYNPWGYTEETKKAIIDRLTDEFTRPFFVNIIKGVKEKLADAKDAEAKSSSAGEIYITAKGPLRALLETIPDSKRFLIEYTIDLLNSSDKKLQWLGLVLSVQLSESKALKDQIIPEAEKLLIEIEGGQSEYNVRLQLILGLLPQAVDKKSAFEFISRRFKKEHYHGSMDMMAAAMVTLAGEIGIDDQKAFQHLASGLRQTGSDKWRRFDVIRYLKRIGRKSYLRALYGDYSVIGVKGFLSDLENYSTQEYIKYGQYDGDESARVDDTGSTYRIGAIYGLTELALEGKFEAHELITILLRKAEANEKFEDSEAALECLGDLVKEGKADDTDIQDIACCVIRILRSEDYKQFVKKEEAVRVLEVLSNKLDSNLREEAKEVLLKVAVKKDNSLKIGAAKTLAKFGDKRGEDFLKESLLLLEPPIEGITIISEGAFSVVEAAKALYELKVWSRFQANEAPEMIHPGNFDNLCEAAAAKALTASYTPRVEDVVYDMVQAAKIMQSRPQYSEVQGALSMVVASAIFKEFNKETWVWKAPDAKSSSAGGDSEKLSMQDLLNGIRPYRNEFTFKLSSMGLGRARTIVENISDMVEKAKNAETKAEKDLCDKASSLITDMIVATDGAPWGSEARLEIMSGLNRISRGISRRKGIDVPEPFGIDGLGKSSSAGTLNLEDIESLNVKALDTAIASAEGVLYDVYLHSKLAAEVSKLGVPGTIVINDDSIPPSQKGVVSNIYGKNSPSLKELERITGCLIRLRSQLKPDDIKGELIIISDTQLSGFEKARYLMINDLPKGTDGYLPIAPLVGIAKALLGIKDKTQINSSLKELYRSLCRKPLTDTIIEEYIQKGIFNLELPKPEAYNYQKLEQLQRQALAALIAA